MNDQTGVTPDPANDWAGAYPVSTIYALSLQPEMAPERLDLVLLMHGRQPPDRRRGFRYVELGCGQGATLAGLAAAYPEGAFLGIDFMPQHIAHGRGLGAGAGLDNLRFDEAAFADLAAAPPPQDRFDYVVLHGVYTWISAENRRHLVRLLDKWVAPGGVVYVGYNAMPGWSAATPIRRIFREVLGPDARLDAIGAARAAVERWLEIDEAPVARKIWSRLQQLPNSYLLHEFGAGHSTALWTGELVADFAAARLERIGSTQLATNFAALALADDQIAFVNDAAGAGFGTTARDLVDRRTFRQDVFSRGAPALVQGQVIRAVGALIVEHVAPVLACEQPEHHIRDLDDGLAARVAEALDPGPVSGAEAIDRLGLEPRAATQTLLVSLASGQARVLRPAPLAETAEAPSTRFNLLARQRRADGAALPGLVSARLGTVCPLSPAETAAAFGAPSAAPAVVEALKRLGLWLGAGPAPGGPG